jgi:omega-6 fatty acid desaturase (delta-12 desaturase)
MAKPAWYQAIGKFAHSDRSKSRRQLLDTFIPYSVLWALMLYSIRQEYSYWVTLALAVKAGSILVRVFILFHDCCHGSFFESRRANTILGYISGILTFTPYEDWRYAHNMHHATAGDLDRRGVGAIWTMTKEEYLAAPWRRRPATGSIAIPSSCSVRVRHSFLFFQRFTTKGAERSAPERAVYQLGALAIAAGPVQRLVLRLIS